MNGWALSGSQKANHHWQSGGGGHTIAFNPFSGYLKPSTWKPMNGIGIYYDSTKSNGIDYVCYGTGPSTKETYSINGVYVPGTEPSDLVKQVRGKFAPVPNLYGRIKVRFKTTIADDVTFYWLYHYPTSGDTSEAPIAYSSDTVQYEKQIRTLAPSGTIENTSGDTIAEYKITGTQLETFTPSWSGYTFSGRSLNDGFDIYVKMQDNANDVFAVYSPNATTSGYIINMWIRASRALTDDELSAIKDDKSDAFLITVTSEATTEEAFNNVSATS